MGWLFPWLLFLHVLGAIIAFGPTFAFPIIGAMGGKEPQHANFATRAAHLVGQRLDEPLADHVRRARGEVGVLGLLAAHRPDDREGERGPERDDRAEHVQEQQPGKEPVHRVPPVRSGRSGR